MAPGVDRAQVLRAAAALRQWVGKQRRARGAADGGGEEDEEEEEGEMMYLNVSMKHVHLGGDPVKSVKPRKMCVPRTPPTTPRAPAPPRSRATD